MRSINIPQVLSCIFKEKFKELSLSLKHTTYPGKDSSPFFLFDRTCSQFLICFGARASSKKKIILTLNPTPSSFFSELLSVFLPHTPYKYAQTVRSHPCGPTSSPLGWSDTTHHVQTASGHQFNGVTDSYTQYHTHGQERAGTTNASWFVAWQ